MRRLCSALLAAALILTLAVPALAVGTAVRWDGERRSFFLTQPEG